MAQFVYTMHRVGKVVPPKRHILKNISLSFFPGAKIGVLGLNGAGKSTLLRIMAGIDKDIEGEARPQPDIKIGYLPQEPQLNPEHTVRESIEEAVSEVVNALKRLDEVYALYADPDADFDKLAAEQGRLEEIIQAHDGHNLNVQLERAADALRLPDWDAKIANLSGGERRRVALCRLLLEKPDMLLLDEPTNHLDLDAILWLEDFLKSYQGTLLLISHDRDFLDAVVDNIAHVEQKKITLYRGGYTAFERARAERLAQQQQAFEKQQAQRAHMESYIARFKAQATKARQAQSRIKALERMEELSAAHVDSPFDFVFRESVKISSPLLDLSDARLGYGDKTILEKVKLQLTPGARIGLLGPNGAGKSTLIKNLSGELEPLAGRLTRGENTVVGYFAQHQLDSLDAKASPLLHLQRLAPTEREQTLRDFLGGFDFRGARIDEPVLNFSGGEKARLALALIAWDRPNLLLLDEPTNHLDAESVAWLERFLHDFEGTVVAITHDRYFLDNVAGWILELDRGEGIPWEGNYSSWLEQKDQRLAQEASQEAARRKSIEKELEWVRQGTKGRQSKGKARLARFEELNSTEYQKRNETNELFIPPGPRLGDKVLEVSNLRKSYGDRLLIDDLSFSIPKGAIVGIIGPNGAGKSTLFRMISGQEQPDSGTITLGETVKLASVDQFRDSMDNSKTVWEEVSGGLDIMKIGNTEMPSRAYVGRFNFKGVDQGKRVGELSGGERGRLHLAKLLQVGGNMLLLDEPTNDLDIETLRALENALLEFPGCAMVISHDRWFLDRIATHILDYQDEGKVEFFEGNFTEYEEYKKRTLGADALEPKRIKYKRIAK